MSATACFTTENKSRLTVIDVLTNYRKRSFLLNREAFTYFDIFRFPAPVIQQLGQEEFFDLLDKHISPLGPQQRNHLIDAAAIAAYHAQMEFPMVRLLICDNAPQFKLVIQSRRRGTGCMTDDSTKNSTHAYHTIDNCWILSLKNTGIFTDSCSNTKIIPRQRNMFDSIMSSIIFFQLKPDTTP